MKRLLRTAFAGGAAVGITGTASALVTALTFVDERAPDAVLYAWARSILRAAGVRHVAEGLEHLPAGNFVLAVNHLSHFDALLLFAHIERHMRVVAKQQLRRIPVFGYAMERAGNIFVDRSGGGKDQGTLHHAARAVRERVSVVFFAEGTRSDDGQLRPFKKGAAMMALEAQVPLVPAAIAGTHLILPKGSVVIHPKPAALVVGAPIETVGLTSESREALTLQAHDAVAALLSRGNELIATLG